MLSNLTQENSTTASSISSLNARALAARLVREIKGEVRFDDGSRALYATDASSYRQVPIGVVIPRDIDDVIATVALCREFGAPVLSRGGGTSLAGQCCNVAVVIDFSKYMNKILDIDPHAKTARVEPGVILDHLRNAAEQHHLTFAPDPSTHNHNTLGGMIGNNSCGVHSVMGGKTDDNILELDILTYDGERMTLGQPDAEEYTRILSRGGRQAQIYGGLKALAERYGDEIRKRFPDIPRRVSGYNLTSLLPENGFNVARSVVGSEGTCVIVLNATVRLVDSPPERSLLVLGYPDVYSAGDHVPEIMKHKPIGLEGIDAGLIADMQSVHLHPGDAKFLPEGHGWLLVEFGGATREEADAQARHVMSALKTKTDAPSMKLFDDPDEAKHIWEVRESGLGATAHLPDKPLTWEGWEDSSVPPENLGKYLRKLRALFDKYQYDGDLYGHFGQGCVHTRINFDLTSKGGIEKYKKFITEAAHLVVGMGGSISGEHGDGQSKAQLLPIMYGDTLMTAFHEFKALWDPQWKMNPGKIIAAHHVDENLRLGATYRPVEVTTVFRYPDDEGQFSRALLRCVGVGKCRKQDAGTMCPSYMATMEEKYSTRGRAHLLFEAMQGNLLHDGWQDENVKDALDLCLSCKGCKGECPVFVDMATLKAEYLSHYYQKKRRPLQAYAFGLIDRWARLAAPAPRIANFFMAHKPFSSVMKSLLNIAPQRKLPMFAPQTFQRTYQRPDSAINHRKVLLFADTFNNHWHPETLHSAAAVLQHAGCDVHVPKAHLCCGRPLYEFGMMDHAVAYLENVLRELDTELRNGTPIIVLEPACATTFRDELTNLMPHDERAVRLRKQTYLLSEFLNELDGYVPPQVNRKAVVHGHCMHKSVLKMQAHNAILKNADVKMQILDSGCCGMAGSFGFDKHKHDVSIKIGERVLLPAVRNADEETLIIANGYSCREQIAQTTGKRALHLADVLAMGLPLEKHS